MIIPHEFLPARSSEFVKWQAGANVLYDGEPSSSAQLDSLACAMKAKDAQPHKRSRDRDDDGNGRKNDGHDGDNDVAGGSI